MSFGLYCLICFFIYAVFSRGGLGGCVSFPLWVIVCLAFYMGTFMNSAPESDKPIPAKTERRAK